MRSTTAWHRWASSRLSRRPGEELVDTPERRRCKKSKLLAFDWHPLIASVELVQCHVFPTVEHTLPLVRQQL